MKPEYVVTVRGRLPSNVAEQVESAHVAAVLAATHQEGSHEAKRTPAPKRLVASRASAPSSPTRGSHHGA